MQDITFLPGDDWGFPLFKLSNQNIQYCQNLCKNAAFFLSDISHFPQS